LRCRDGGFAHGACLRECERRDECATENNSYCFHPIFPPLIFHLLSLDFAANACTGCLTKKPAANPTLVVAFTPMRRFNLEVLAC
jgi:hypothetical protein